VAFSAPWNNGGAAITGYTVTSTPGGITATGFHSPITVSGLANGIAYTFAVTATNSVGTGPATRSNSVTPSGPVTTAPGAPSGVWATAGNGNATVHFGAPLNTGGTAVTGYTVTSNPGGKTNSGAGSPITVSGLTNGIAYTFMVTATNSKGTGPASFASNSVTLKGPVTPVTALPGAPSGAWATAGNGNATVSFGAPWNTGGTAIINYTVSSDPGGFTASGAASPITVEGLTRGVAYTFTVTAANSAGTGPSSMASNSVTPQSLTAPSTPRGVWATAGKGSATVNFYAPWDNGGATVIDYKVTCIPTAGGGPTVTQEGGSGSPITVTGLANGTEYSITVQARNSVGYGVASSPRIVTTKP